MIFFAFSSSSRSCIISLWNLFWVMTILIWMRQDQLPEIRFPKTLNYLTTTTCIILLTAAWQSINDIQIQYSTWEQAVWANEWNVPAANLVMPLSFRVSTQHGKYLSDKWFFVNSSNSPFFQLLIIETLLAGLPLRGAVSPDYYECGPQLLS